MNVNKIYTPKSHDTLGNLPDGWDFELDGPEGKDKYDVRKIFRRIAECRGVVVCRVVHSHSNDKGSRLDMEPEQVVRPHKEKRTDGMFSFRVRTPEEIADAKALEAEYRRIDDEIDKQVEDAVRAAGQELHVNYSASPIKNKLPVNNLGDVAFKGECIVSMHDDGFWGKGVTYSKRMENPTWLDLAVACNEGIVFTGDYHHIFFEGAGVRCKDPSTGLPVLELFTGS